MIKERLVREQRAWHLSWRSTVVLLAGPIAMLVVYAGLYVGAKDRLRSLAAEDGVIEWLQAVCFLAACVAAIGASVTLARRRDLMWAAVFAVIAAGSLFIAGEELAWGQRILDFGTPEGLRSINEKDELSLHNITSIERMFIIGKMMAGIVGGLGPWIALVARRDRGYFFPCAVSTFFVAALAIHLANRAAGTTPVGSSETEELFISLGLVIHAVLAWRRARLSA